MSVTGRNIRIVPTHLVGKRRKTSKTGRNIRGVPTPLSGKKKKNIKDRKKYTCCADPTQWEEDEKRQRQEEIYVLYPLSGKN